jgi:hypothetical protein
MRGYLEIGDKVLWRGTWGLNVDAVVGVERIEITQSHDPKHGKIVDKISWDDVHNPEVQGVVDLDNRKWAYFDQIEPYDGPDED